MPPHCTHLVVAIAALVPLTALRASHSFQAAGQSAGAANPRAVEEADASASDVERGRYLVEHVVMCFECHSPRDQFGQLLESQRYMGGPIPARPSWADDWAVQAPRIRGLPGYTDELAMRVLTSGAIGRDGNPLRLPMPRFRMSQDDAAAVVAFIRSLH